MSHEQHGWLESAFDEENSNRYQPGAPLAVYCTKCKTVLRADDDWVKRATDGDARSESILLAKIDKWDNPNIIVQSAGQDGRGRLQLEFEYKAPPAPQPPPRPTTWGFVLLAVMIALLILIGVLIGSA